MNLEGQDQAHARLGTQKTAQSFRIRFDSELIFSELNEQGTVAEGIMWKRKAYVGATGIVLCLVAGCAPIELVSKYDNQTDESASAMQKDVSAFIIKMQTALSPPEASFLVNQDFYRKQAVNIGAMQLRAQAIPNNKLTIDQLQLTEDNLAYLALLHKGCVTGNLSDEQKPAVRQNGIDASVACRVTYGATTEAPDRGASVLNPVILPVLASQFDSSLGAIMKLEIAKRRGEK